MDSKFLTKCIKNGFKCLPEVNIFNLVVNQGALPKLSLIVKCSSFNQPQWCSASHEDVSASHDIIKCSSGQENVSTSHDNVQTATLMCVKWCFSGVTPMGVLSLLEWQHNCLKIILLWPHHFGFNSSSPVRTDIVREFTSMFISTDVHRDAQVRPMWRGGLADSTVIDPQGLFSGILAALLRSAHRKQSQHCLWRTVHRNIIWGLQRGLTGD